MPYRIASYLLLGTVEVLQLFIDNGWSGKSGIFQAMLHRLNISLLDSSPKVQASCCAATAVLA